MAQWLKFFMRKFLRQTSRTWSRDCQVPGTWRLEVVFFFAGEITTRKPLQIPCCILKYSVLSVLQSCGGVGLLDVYPGIQVRAPVSACQCAGTWWSGRIRYVPGGSGHNWRKQELFGLKDSIFTWGFIAAWKGLQRRCVHQQSRYSIE